ncbi:MAG: glycosyltransferase [Myxococcota bacterium]|nr:glycosyltransferase [Myxococcota bacterium]
MSERRPRAALFATQFGAYSQTFIYDEARLHTRYDIEVFSRVRSNHDAFPFEPVHTVNGRLPAAVYGVTTYSRQYMKRLKDGDFDLIHAHFGPGSIYALPYQRATKLPLVVTYHGYDVPLLMTSRRFHPSYWRYWLRSKSMFRNVNRFLAASNELHDLLIELGAPPEKVKVWRLGVFIPELNTIPERSGQNIVMVGRFTEKKGHIYGLEAFGKLLQQGVDATLHLVGDGELRPDYDAVIRHFDMADRVQFHGVLSHPDVLALMEGMDVLMCPSVIAANGDRESGILVAKEAGARYVPVIGTYHGGIPEIIDDQKTGFLVPERDSEALGQRLWQLMTNPELREKMGRAAREKMVREYDIVERIDVLERHYDEVRQGIVSESGQ